MYKANSGYVEVHMPLDTLYKRLVHGLNSEGSEWHFEVGDLEVKPLTTFVWLIEIRVKEIQPSKDPLIRRYATRGKIHLEVVQKYSQDKPLDVFYVIPTCDAHVDLDDALHIVLFCLSPLKPELHLIPSVDDQRARGLHPMSKQKLKLDSNAREFVGAIEAILKDPSFCTFPTKEGWSGFSVDQNLYEDPEIQALFAQKVKNFTPIPFLPKSGEITIRAITEASNTFNTRNLASKVAILHVLVANNNTLLIVTPEIIEKAFAPYYGRIEAELPTPESVQAIIAPPAGTQNSKAELDKGTHTPRKAGARRIKANDWLQQERESNPDRTLTELEPEYIRRRHAEGKPLEGGADVHATMTSALNYRNNNRNRK